MQSQFTDKAKLPCFWQGGRQKPASELCWDRAYPAGPDQRRNRRGIKGSDGNGAKEEAIREMIQDLLAPETPNPVIERDGYSPRAEEVLEESHRQAEKAGSALTGTEHILLALLGDGDNVAVRVLQTLSLPLQKIMRDTLLAAGLDPTAYREELGRRQKRARPGRWSFTAGI